MRASVAATIRLQFSTTLNPQHNKAMSSCLIRPATMRDAKAIAEIHASAGAGAGGDAATRTPSNGAPTIDRQQVFWREAIEFGEPQLQVACDAEKVIGFVGFDRCRDKGTPPTMGEIWSIYVVPSYWDQGVGLALWDASREGLLEEGCSEVSIWIALGNERALRFHELAGFKRELSSARTVPAFGARVEEIRLRRKIEGP
jgi:ribosomal protein S18 acetylase RimI-like enzyme